MLRTVVVLVALVSSSAVALAKGGDERDVRGDWLAAPDVRALVSTTAGGALHRALVRVEADRPTLVLEVVRAGATVERRVVTHVQHGLSTLPLASVARGIEALAARDGRLTFELELTGARGPLRCALALGSIALPVCQRLLAPRAVDLDALDAACVDAFTSAERAASCRTVAARSAYDPAGSVRACDRALHGDAATLECIAIASRYPFAAADSVAACERASLTDEATLVCIKRGGAY